MLKLGLDVGGTNTDAVLLDEANRILAKVKHPTSGDVYEGIAGAMRAVLSLSGANPAQVGLAMLGTTQCTNAIVERKQLAPVGVLRIGAPATLGIRPMADWPEELRRVCAEYAVIGGGFEYDGREIAPLDEAAARSFFARLRGRVQSVAVVSVFSTVRRDHETRAAALCREVLGESVPVTLSCEIGAMGLIERENAAILNAALYPVARRFTDGFARSLAEEDIRNARIYISQNDGTLMTMEQARRYPILTIACGPTNSIRGAGYLSGQRDAIVLDIGGTTTDLGVIQNGFPRESGTAAAIGGIRTNFRMPDVLSIGLGGGSIVRRGPDGAVTVGPDSVGYELSRRALVFGGDTVTATDIAVRLGMASLGEPARAAQLDEDFAKSALAVIVARVEDGIDAMKVSAEDVDVILVGGGSILLPSRLAGTARVLKPPHFEVANAVGSAIGMVSGSWEELADYNRINREDAMANARARAEELAVAAGADPATIELIDAEEVPLAYHPGNTCRIKIKSAGSLR